LEPRTPTTIHMSPYDLRDVYIPVLMLEPGTEYWIKASFEGGYAIEPIMKRKPIALEQQNEDFVIRFGQRLRDHRYPS